MLSRWLKNIATAGMVVWLIWYLATHWQELKPLLRFSAVDLAAVYAISGLGIINTGYFNKRLLQGLSTNTRLWDMIVLQNAVYLLNYLPMKFGTLFRANYLKRHYGLSYTYFGIYFSYLTSLMLATTATIGAVILPIVYGVNRKDTAILFSLFVTIAAAGYLLALAPLPLPRGTNKVSSMLRNFITGRQQIVANKRIIAECAFLLVVNFLLTSVRLGIIYHSIKQQVHPAGFLILGAMGYVTMFVSLTPGALGVREIVLGSGATILGVPLEVGLLAAMLDRAIALSWSFTIGSACTVSLWRKYPKDFKKASSENRLSKSKVSPFGE